ncbi:uncharacterized protein LOC143191681 isoform X1 [Rhynchophorus ferrugineus]|uniref:uncharacterized protein LOC143191681 isoform X1 n=1 Tax=Rhynchophorus ferrugineus TaxID=354439 RepID=UPI003FCCC057
MGGYSVLILWPLYCLILFNYGYGQYVSNMPAMPYPYQTALGLYPYQPYPMMPPGNTYQTMPWMQPSFPNNLPNSQALYPTNGSGWIQPTNYLLRAPYPSEWGGMAAPRSGIKTEIVDYDPDYYRIMLGLNPADNQITTPDRSPDLIVNSKTHHTTNTSTDGRTIISQKTYTTTIRRTYVIEPSKSIVEPVDKQVSKDVEITTETTRKNQNTTEEVVDSEETQSSEQFKETTTETSDNQNNTGSNVTQKPRRFIDVPKSCSDGYALDHKANCIKPFFVQG